MNSNDHFGLHLKSILQKAVGLHRQGELDQAEKSYRFILKEIPNHPDALHLLGLIQGDKGLLKKAKELIHRAIELDPKAAAFYVSMGDILKREGHHTEAITYYRKALERNPHRIEPLCNMGNVFRETGRLKQAVNCYHKALRINPNLPEAYNNMGLTYELQKEYDTAKVCYQKAIALNPNYFEAHSNLGNIYRKVTNFEAAISQYKQALSIDPDNTAVNYNLGVLLQTTGNPEKALAYYRKAIEHHPPVADAHNNLGKYYQEQNLPDQAIGHFDQAIKLVPDHFDAHLNRALSLLATGGFKEGWQEYEWRFKRDQWKKVYPHKLAGRRWNGSKFPGKTLLIHTEQGFGDTIWFVRYLPFVKSLGGNVIFEVRPELIDLLNTYKKWVRLIPMSFDHPPKVAYDYYVPLMSLAGVLKTNVKSIPDRVPYVCASETMKKKWAPRIQTNGLNVGLVWAAKTTNAHGRSCPLEEFLPLFHLQGVNIYGLQKGEDTFQLNKFSVKMTNLGSCFKNFADTAGAIENLDLVVSVDTSVAHLAGAMGKPVWIVVPCAADWKWLLQRKDSPWYPTMRIFRQPRPGDWAAAIKRIKSGLIQWIAKKQSEE